MRVIHIMNALCASGAEVMLRLAASEWKNRGLELAIVACADQVGDYAVALRASGYRIYLCRRRRGTQAVQFLRDLNQIITNFDPDVVHIHPEMQCLPVVYTAYKSGDRAIVRTIHNNFPFHGKLRARKILERRLMAWLGVCQISIGESVYETELEVFKNHTHRIDNWVETEHFRPASRSERHLVRQQLGFSEDDHVIVSVGNGSTTKNYSSVIKALRNYKGTRVNYIQVGQEHPEGIDRKIALQLGLEDQVRFIGCVDDVRPFLWAADTYIMPSLYEGNSLAAAEALCTGVPCIFSRSPGLRDWASHPVEVIWAEAPDEVCLLLALQQRMKYSCSARFERNASYVRHAMSPEHGAVEYISAYQRLCAQGYRSVV